MKKILLPIFALFISFNIQAQNQLTPVDTTKYGKATDFDIDIQGEFVNNGPADTFVWENIPLQVANDWNLAICDRNLCYDPSIYSMKFYAEANSTTNMDVHSYPNGKPGTTVTKVKVYRVSNMADSITNTYTFIADGFGASVKKVKSSSFDVYPNPSRDELTINFETNKSIEMKIFNVLGVEVMSHYHITSESKVNVSNLQSGVYFIKFVDASGKAYVKSFKKVN